MPNINIAISDSLHQQLKLNAIAARMTLKQYVIARLQEHVQAEPLLHRPANSRNPQGGAQ